MPNPKIKIPDEVKQDLRNLADKNLITIALSWANELAKNPKLGGELDERRSQPLGKCRRLYFDLGDTPPTYTRKIDGPSYRLIYRLLPSEDNIQYIQIIAIGPKCDDGELVYSNAANRLLSLPTSY